MSAIWSLLGVKQTCTGRPESTLMTRKRSQFLLPLSAFSEMAIEKPVQAASCIVGCLAVVFQPVT